MRRTLLALLACSLVAPAAVRAQSLADRVSRARDGTVVFTYVSRDEVCGDGRGLIAEPSVGGGITIYSQDGSTTMTGPYGRMTGQDRCLRGPARVVLTVEDGRVIDLRPYVGPVATTEHATDLGTVSASEAARWLLDVARTAPERASRNAFLAAGIADSARLSPTLAAIARDRELRRDVRERALRWLSSAADREDDRASLGVVRTIVTDDGDSRDVRERAIRVAGEMDGGPEWLRSVYARLEEQTLRERVIRVVAEDPTSANLSWLRERARDANEGMAIRERAIRVLGEVGGSETSAWLRTLVYDESEVTSLRERAIRVLAERGDIAHLRSMYPRLREQSLRERILREVGAAGGDEGTAFLRRVALDSAEPDGLRDRALRMLAESGLPSADLVKLYDTLPERDLRVRLISLLAERGDRTARDKLESIAQSESDPELRRRAVKRLGEMARR